jgi:mRNA interferase MazF
MTDNEQNKNAPLRHTPILRAIPKIKQLFWCDFPAPEHAHAPEFATEHPVIVISFKQKSLLETVTIIPCTSQEKRNEANPWAIELSTKIDKNKNTYAICDKITTVSISRLRLISHKQQRITDDEFAQIISCLEKWLPIPIKNT